MSITGIIAEFNPLHNGHKRLIDYARNVLHSDRIIVIMSGNFTQRGECTIIDKYTRADTAIACGADLVLQMPVCASTMNADDFAKCGVSILDSTKIVDNLLFGSETDDLNLLFDASKKSRDELLVFSSKPNTILGIEYIRALELFHSSLKPIAINRIGSDYNSKSIKDETPSSTAIRNALLNSNPEVIKPFVPPATYSALCKCISDNTIVFSDDLSSLLHYKLLTIKKFDDYLLCNRNLSDKIIKYRDQFVSISSFIPLLKSKDIRYSRLSRMLAHILLDIKKEHINALKDCDYVPYLHILKASEKGKAMLKDIKTNSKAYVFASVNEVKDKLNEKESLLLDSDILADDIYRNILTTKTNKVFPTEYTRKTCL